MAVKLYSYFRSSASYRVRIALNLKNISYEYIPIHLLNNGGEQLKTAYKSINPMAQVPTLVHDGKALAQSMAIIQYIDEQWPTPALFPTPSYERAKVIEVCEAFNSGIQPLHNLSVLNYLGSHCGQSDEGKKQWSLHWIRLGFEKMEVLLRQTAGTYCFGGKLTAADLFLVPQIFGAKRFNLDMRDFPTIAGIEKNCLRLEAFQKAHPERQPDFS